jgi:hypothetical protein
MTESKRILDITSCGPLKANRPFGKTYRLHLQGRRQEEIRERTSVSRCNRLEAIRSSETSVKQYLHGATSNKTVSSQSPPRKPQILHNNLLVLEIGNVVE